MELHPKLVRQTFNQPERQAKLLALRLFRSLGTDKLEAALRGRHRNAARCRGDVQDEFTFGGCSLTR